MTHIGKRVALAAFAIFSFMPTLFYAYLGTFSRPMYDDYIRIGLPLDIGIWDTMLFSREQWHGDYTSFLFQGLLAPLGSMAPSVFCLLHIFAMFLGYSWLINTILARMKFGAHRRLCAAAVASLAAAATINSFYDFHVFFFYSSAVDYSFPAALLLLGIAISVETAEKLRRRFQQALAAALIVFLSFLNAGFSEVYVAFQMICVALIAVFVFSLYRGLKRGIYCILALAACLGTLASLLLQLSSPGLAYRTSLSDNYGIPVAPARDLPHLLGSVAELLLKHLGDENVFAGFMLVASAGLFVTLAFGARRPANIDLRRVAAARSPIALALILQLLFLPVLWAHQSDSAEVLGRFSYAFMSVVSINFCVIFVLLACLWRRDLLEAALNRPNGLMIYCCGILLGVCVLFVMTQIRSIHYRASIYLFFTAAAALLTLAGQLTLAVAEPRLNKLLQLSLCFAASAAIAMASLIAAFQFAVGYVLLKSICLPIFLLTCAGFSCGVMLGGLIQQGASLTGSSAIWLRWMRLLLLLFIMALVLAQVLSQTDRLEEKRIKAEIWDAASAEIYRMRAEEDPAVYTKTFKRITFEGIRLYEMGSLGWHELAFYDLEYDLPENPNYP